MDSLLLLCRVDAFLVRESGMFVHNVCGCADCNCVGSAKSLHSVDWEYIYVYLEVNMGNDLAPELSGENERLGELSRASKKL
ncbi:unnamed protein product [Heligmosomoides polygyrus]|uniref:CENP-V/GFA domain-containing protein n=1 Tax=Heligmosomoides polygyrus TaxID=6339 RepID=A0A183GFQ9_HELPZ|nr:unnamed protein product [Heligmosomoides polygyrus]